MEGDLLPVRGIPLVPSIARLDELKILALFSLLLLCEFPIVYYPFFDSPS